MSLFSHSSISLPSLIPKMNKFIVLNASMLQSVLITVVSQNSAHRRQKKEKHEGSVHCCIFSISNALHLAVLWLLIMEHSWRWHDTFCGHNPKATPKNVLPNNKWQFSSAPLWPLVWRYSAPGPLLRSHNLMSQALAQFWGSSYWGSKSEWLCVWYAHRMVSSSHCRNSSVQVYDLPEKEE